MKNKQIMRTARVNPTTIWTVRSEQPPRWKIKANVLHQVYREDYSFSLELFASKCGIIKTWYITPHEAGHVFEVYVTRLQDEGD